MDDSTRADFAEFVAVQARPILGFAHALMADPHDAWDLTQETLARMGERWGRTTYDTPAAYARTVMVRLNIDRIRRLRRELPRSTAGPDDGRNSAVAVDPPLAPLVMTRPDGSTFEFEDLTISCDPPRAAGGGTSDLAGSTSPA